MQPTGADVLIEGMGPVFGLLFLWLTGMGIYQFLKVRDLAEAAQRSVPSCELVYLNEHTDPRTYRVSFERILTELKDYYKPKWNLDKGGKELVEYFKKVHFTEDDFRGIKCNRLKQLRLLVEQNKLNNELEWI